MKLQKLNRLLTAALLLLAASTSAHGQSVRLPKVEIFPNQPGTILFQGQIQPLQLTGAVYDQAFRGFITLEPNGPKATACPAFLLGGNPFYQIPLNGSFTASLVLQAPANAAPGTYNCALRYTAIDQIINVGDFSVGKGNQVNVPYTVKKAR